MEMTKLNELQMPTWQWLKLNNAAPVRLVPPAYHREARISQNVSAAMLAKDTEIQSFGELPADVREILDSTVLNQNAQRMLTIPEGADIAEPIYIDFELMQGEVLYDLLRINAGKDSRSVVVIRFRSAPGVNCFRSGMTYLEIAAGAHLTLVVQQSLSSTAGYHGAIFGRVDSDAFCNVVTAELGANQSTSNCMIELSGDRSKAQIESLYLGDNRQRKDLKYNLRFCGRETQGAIEVKGALAGSARKILKSNIDFVKGAEGADGRESESVLVLSDKVTNVSVPLLLCGEDDVAGEHATSTGKPDEDQLFYLMSRGFSPAEARKLLVEASFTPILDKMPDTVRAEVMTHIREVMK